MGAAFIQDAATPRTLGVDHVGVEVLDGAQAVAAQLQAVGAVPQPVVSHLQSPTAALSLHSMIAQLMTAYLPCQ